MSLTAKVITATVVVLGLVELVSITVGGTPTISRFMQNSAFEAPFISFSVGFTCGHIFGYMPQRKAE